MDYFLAIDIGASSGRHIISYLQDGKLEMKEVYRFPNRPDERNGKLTWDTDRLFGEILTGIKKCKEAGFVPKSMGIDTWGVDYVLIDGEGQPILPAYSYRDLRTVPYTDTVVPFSELYEHTGIQFQSYNSIYQLLADKAEGRLDKAKKFLLLPEYFSYLLTGKSAKEYTNSTTTGLVSAKTRTWDFDIIERLSLPSEIFSEPVQPGYYLGNFKAEIIEQVGFDCKVILPATHDTASAVAALPQKDALYISSGTWSLLGIQSDPVLTDKAREFNYANEGALFGKVRFQKNIMGMWIIQQVRHEQDCKYSFAEYAAMAEKEAVYDWSLDINDDKFFSPKSMLAVIEEQCNLQGQPVPKTPGEIAHCIYNSLAHSYKTAIDELESMTKVKYTELCVIGGGCKNDYINKLTAKYTGLKVYAGPDEATAAGNLLVQLMADGAIKPEQTEELVKKSFNIKEI